MKDTLSKGNVLSEVRLNIICMVSEYGGCVADHVRGRFFPAPGARSVGYAHIAWLVKEGYLASFRLPPSTGTGSGKAFLTVGARARPILAKRLGVRRAALRRRRHEYAPQFVAHHLAICDFRLFLERAVERQPEVELVEWTPEFELKLHPYRVEDPETKDTVSIVPDGQFTLARRDGGCLRFLMEMDMGTMAPRRMQEKLRCYLVLAKLEPTPILFVVPTVRRREMICTWATTEAAKTRTDPTIFWVCVRSDLSKDTILNAAIWQVAGGPERMALAPSLAHVVFQGGEQ